jgi:hypothetical protein
MNNGSVILFARRFFLACRRVLSDSSVTRKSS